eukprot:TRINITY_DN15468_c0_g3_i2.p1 TRINITY_DN15468_c0_g3~~TRINITY_DN15468_c0_g3_i2.p1  ORF type:complete len:511 (-),score=103.07 TRINITY_DN15468_c0_g3_i2:431-1963(-)
MGEGLHCPLPVFRWQSFKDSFPRIFGFGGIDLTPHVYLKLKGPLSLLNVLLKVLLFGSYLVWALFISKNYLYLAHTDGTHRLQLQHPVKNHCNPLEIGCKTNFSTYDELPYCKQNSHKVDPQKVGKQNTCEYFDEFDVNSNAASFNSGMLVTTRKTHIRQKLLCNGQEGYCENKYKVLNENTIFVADIESFTLLIDHSMVCNDLGMSHSAWDLVGLYKHCKPGPQLPYLSEAEEDALTDKCTLLPITRLKDHEDETFQDMELRGFNMWTQVGFWSRLFPFFTDRRADVKSIRRAPMVKIPNGDIIRIKELLEELDVDLDAPRSAKEPHKTRRHEGLVLVVTIEYANYMRFTWPNSLPPVYTYKFTLSPASEYKEMLTSAADHDERVIEDLHGLYVVVQQQGNLGEFSWFYVALMFIGGLALESIVRWLTVMIALNLLQGEAGEDFERDMIYEVAIEAEGPDGADYQPIMSTLSGKFPRYKVKSRLALETHERERRSGERGEQEMTDPLAP